MLCPECGNKTEENAKFCNKCGHSLKKDIKDTDKSLNEETNVSVENDVDTNASTEVTTSSTTAACKTKKKTSPVLITIVCAASVIAIALVAVIAYSVMNPNNKLGTNGSSSTSSTVQGKQVSKDFGLYEDVIAEYNTLFAQGNSVAWINPNYADTNGSKLIKPVCNELRSEGFNYLPSQRNDLPTQYCFRDLNDDGQDELIVLGARFGVLGIYYYDREKEQIIFDSNFCNDKILINYDSYNVYFTSDNKLVETAGVNDPVLVKDVSQTPAKLVVKGTLSDSGKCVDQCGTISDSQHSGEMIEKVKAAYPADESTQWIDFDGKNGKDAKPVDKWWLTKTPVLTGTLKWMTFNELVDAKPSSGVTEKLSVDSKMLVLVADQETTVQAEPGYKGPNYDGHKTSVNEKYFNIFPIDDSRFYSDVISQNFFGSETYGTFEGKHVKVSCYKVSRSNDVLCLLCTNLTGVRCEIID